MPSASRSWNAVPGAEGRQNQGPPASLLMEYAKAGAQGTEPPPLLTRPANPQALVDAARAHNCVSIVAGPLLSQPGCCSPELADELERIQSQAWAAHMLTAAAIGPVLMQASDEKITLAVYKGAAQASRYYAHPWMRSMADVDVLVNDGQQARLYDILSARGFRLRFTPGRVLTERVSHERSYAPPAPGARMIDIHTSPAPPARYRLPVRDMIARAPAGTLFDAPVRFLTAEDELLVMAVNQAYDHFRLGFLRYLDAWLVSTRSAVNWESLVSTARQAGAATTTWVTLSNAKRIAGVPVPAEILAEIQPSPVRRAWIHAALRTEGPGDPRFALSRRLEQVLLVYPMIDHPRDFVRFAAFHGALRLLDAGQELVHRVLGREQPARPASSPRADDPP